MKIDLEGRVRNIPLPASKPLIPLYEAIVNSIHAIEDAKIEDGIINISIVREQSLLDDRSVDNILGFEISDNGIGFNDANFTAFQTSDTTYKENRGGKGIGRFFWLVAFNQVQIESHYRDNDTMLVRKFSFVAKGDGIKDEKVESSDKSSNETTVKLHGFIDKFKITCPKKLDTIASHIIEHCLEYFICANCPKIYLYDKSTNDKVDLNDFFEMQMKKNSASTSFKIKNQQFHMRHVQLRSVHIKEHSVYFCAHSRVVTSEKLIGRIPNLSKKLLGIGDSEFVYVSYVDSVLLDASVSADRMDFGIGEEPSIFIDNEITWNDIRSEVFNQCQIYLSSFLEPIKKMKKERIEKYVSETAPMYRPLMRHLGNRIDSINPESSDNDLDISLYKAYQDIQIELKTEGQKLLDDVDDADKDFAEFEERLKIFFEKVTDLNKSDLARYVCHRKAIIEFLSKQLTVKEDGKYRREGQIHNVIFPMGKTSEEVPFEKHNLWLIDEKLVYHAFLASDKQIGSIPVLESESKKEPDIIIFDKAFAFVTDNDPPFSSIIIIEFKKPLRSDYSEDSNPFKQVCDYIEDINSGKAKTYDGRPISIPKDVPFYCFIVCDDVKSLSKQADRYELTKTPDNQGYFGYKKAYNAYFEVISYTKMVTDAKKRNAAFFDKLGLSSRI